MGSKTIVLPSTRSIRNRLLSHEDDTFLHNYLSMSDFLAKVVYVEGKRFADADTRTVLLLEASDFEHFKKLQIERNFFTFTKNASYIFDFFEELAAELVDIEDIEKEDLYAEYEEHLQILKELKRRYEKLCEERGLSDRIFLPKNYEINTKYLQKIEEVEIFVEGLLSSFEMQLLDKIAQHTALMVHVRLGKFNEKMRKRLQEHGFDVARHRSYKLEWRQKKVVHSEPLPKNRHTEVFAVSQRILQVAVVKQKVYEYIKKGYDPQKIAVILPDESFAELLELFDEKNNFNFAMGSSFKKSGIYKKLRATLDAMDEMTVMNEAHLERVGVELYSELFGMYKKRVFEIDLERVFGFLREFCTQRAEKELFEEEMHRFLKLTPYLQELSLKAVLTMFLNRLASLSIDDVGGGKITVMGVLETRGVSFDAVVIVDFNESKVPKRLEKDMFLNSTIRKRAGLPTSLEREELQKHYYHTLMQRSKEVAVCYVSDTAQLPSRFLQELGEDVVLYPQESALATLLFNVHTNSPREQEEIVAAYDFRASPLSNAKLSTYLTCKRKFYYRYIAHIEKFDIPKEIPQEWEIGQRLHEALKRVYERKKSFTDASELHGRIIEELQELSAHNELERFQVSLYSQMLHPFCANEVKRFSQGTQVLHVERNLKTKIEGIELSGIIDRVDRVGDALEVLDYKSGSLKLYTAKSVENATDFQLEFYHLLASANLGKVAQVAFYDLKTGKIVPEQHFERKMELLYEHLHHLGDIKEIEALRCDDRRNCEFCEYKIMCGRE